MLLEKNDQFGWIDGRLEGRSDRFAGHLGFLAAGHQSGGPVLARRGRLVPSRLPSIQPHRNRFSLGAPHSFLRLFYTDLWGPDGGLLLRGQHIQLSLPLQVTVGEAGVSPLG